LGLFFVFDYFGTVIADQPGQLIFRFIKKYVILARKQKHG
jgi:hypothetical protein